MAWGLPGPFDPRHQPLQPVRGYLDLQAPDMSKQLQAGIASILPSLAEAYKGTNEFMRNQQAGDDFLAASKRAGAPGGAAGPTGGYPSQYSASTHPQTQYDAKNLTQYDQFIKDTAKNTGLSEDYLRNLIRVESGGAADAKSNLSSAKGLTQFTDNTWKLYGGGGNVYDPKTNIEAAGRYALANRASLTQALGRAPTDGELYLAHQLGDQGAIKVLSNPNARAADLVGERAVLNNGGRADMTAGQYAQLWTGKFGGTTGAAPGPNVSPVVAGASAVSSGRLSDPALAYKTRMQEMFPQVKITSEFRSLPQNQAVGGAQGSQHLTGNALDVNTTGMTEEQKAALIDDAIANGARGIGWYNPNSMHIDFRSTPAAWGPNKSKTSLGATPPWFRERAARLANLPAVAAAPSTAPAAAPAVAPAAAAPPALPQPGVQVASADPSFVPTPPPQAQSTPGMVGQPGLFQPAPSAPAPQLAGAPNMSNNPLPDVSLPAQPLTGSPSQPLPDTQLAPAQVANATPTMIGGTGGMTMPPSVAVPPVQPPVGRPPGPVVPPADTGGGQVISSEPIQPVIDAASGPAPSVRRGTGPGQSRAAPPPAPAVAPPAPVPAPAAVQPSPADQPAPTASPAGFLPPAAVGAANRLGLSVDQLQDINPRFLSALGHAIKGGNPSMVSAIVQGINAATAASTASQKNRQTVQGADGTIYEVTPDGRYVPVIPGKRTGQGDDLIIDGTDLEGKKRFGIPDDGRPWRIGTDAQGNKTKTPITEPTFREDKSFQQENELSKGFETNKQMNEFKQAHVAVESLDAAFGEATPAGDVNGMVQVFKGIDPTSTVSVTETGQIIGSGGAESWAQKWINKVNRTGLLTAQDRADFYNAARAQLARRAGPARDFYNGTVNRAKARKLDPAAATNGYQFPDIENMPRKTAEDYKDRFGVAPGERGSVDNPVEVYSEMQGDSLPPGVNYVIISGPNAGATGTSDGSKRGGRK